MRGFDQHLLQTLLAGTVKALQEEIPGLGETVAFDVKHLYAWVKENNERVYVPDRYDKTQRLAGDPDCRLGVKRSTNQEQPDGSTKAKKELLWGYGTGVAVSTIAEYGTVVLAEYTQPFNETDITYFRSLSHQATLALNQFPTNLAADAAYDAWYVYEAAARHGGIAAVPLNQHSKTPFARQADGTPLCPSVCLCIRLNSSTTPLAIVLNGSSVPCFSLRERAKHVRTNSSSKAKAVSKM